MRLSERTLSCISTFYPLLVCIFYPFPSPMYPLHSSQSVHVYPTRTFHTSVPSSAPVDPAG
jgi:hypothetical protein